jgi:hypothetical protein
MTTQAHTPATQPRSPSKLDLLAALLSAPDGATMKTMTEATGWQPHSVRGAMAGALRKRGLKIASARIDGVRRWSLEVGAAR